tara:strand:+ start:55 stop:657 length:603 start_codon:yes stop_codon:yes gene_type:complete
VKKKIAITMRETTLKENKEVYDSIDQNFFLFSGLCNFEIFLLPNKSKVIEEINLNSFDGIILSGGGNISQISKKKSKRDQLERDLMEFSVKTKKPILGICRGMQVIQSFFGVKLERIKDHVNTRHNINYLNSNIKVNSFHNYGSYKTTHCLKIQARSDDNIIESVKHKNLPIMGIMWHPERERMFKQLDINIFKSFFSCG